jgi:3-phosphoshikimate 1-carboxyvinyltransferase
MFKNHFLDIPALKTVGGTVRLPGSKSISNRVLLLAGLSAGQTVLHNLLDSDDTRVMLDALKVLGCSVQEADGQVHVQGLAGQLGTRSATLFLGNAGTAMRPLTAVLALLLGTQTGCFELRGVPRMHERPIGDLLHVLAQLGCNITCLGQPGFPPLRLESSANRALKLEQPLQIRGDVSSQFLSALLMALPLVSGSGDIAIEVVGELISKPYVDITLSLMAQFGVRVARDGWERFTVPRGSQYQSPGSFNVEGDASSASYFIALGAIAATLEPLRIVGVGSNSIQGDIRFADAARAMGAQVLMGPDWLEVRRGIFPLQAITIDCNHMPDAAMTLALMALYASGTTRLLNIASWRVKETDRITAMSTELRKLGATVDSGPDFISVTPPTQWLPAAIQTYDDHRMAMCFSLAAFHDSERGDSAGTPVRILDPQCVAKTFPSYFETFFNCVGTTPQNIPVITLDGPTASGKGTLASAVAQALGYHFLDSGVVYRATALAAMHANVRIDDEVRLAQLATNLKLQFNANKVRLDGHDVTETLRLEEVGALASKVSAWPLVRAALRTLQISFHRIPGLVADGRDMGTVIFPGAPFKVFLNANTQTRAQRRYLQLIDKGLSANIGKLYAELEARDARDQNRSISPLKPAEDAMLLDNSSLTVEASVAVVLKAWEQRRPFGGCSHTKKV